MSAGTPGPAFKGFPVEAGDSATENGGIVPVRASHDAFPQSLHSVRVLIIQTDTGPATKPEPANLALSS